MNRYLAAMATSAKLLGVFIAAAVLIAVAQLFLLAYFHGESSFVIDVDFFGEQRAETLMMAVGLFLFGWAAGDYINRLRQDTRTKNKETAHKLFDEAEQAPDDARDQAPSIGPVGRSSAHRAPSTPFITSPPHGGAGRTPGAFAGVDERPIKMLQVNKENRNGVSRDRQQSRQ